MASLLDRVRAWFGVNNDHTAEHLDIRTELTQQQMAILRIDAIIEAQTSRRDRRRGMTASHPTRRSTDA